MKPFQIKPVYETINFFGGSFLTNFQLILNDILIILEGFWGQFFQEFQIDLVLFWDQFGIIFSKINFQ